MIHHPLAAVDMEIHGNPNMNQLESSEYVGELLRSGKLKDIIYMCCVQTDLFVLHKCLKLCQSILTLRFILGEHDFIPRHVVGQPTGFV